MGGQDPACKLRRFLASVADWCRRHRHLLVQVQYVVLCRKLVGYNNYFGAHGNVDGLVRVKNRVVWIWHRWLARRSQRRMGWVTFKRMLERYPLPRASVRVQIWLRT